MGHWENKVVVITGGSSGFGLALAKQWGRAGAKLVLVARDQARLNAASDELRKLTGNSPETYSLDLNDAKATAESITEIAARLGRIDLLVNCAGSSTRHSLESTNPDLFREQMDRNFFTAVNCTQAALPFLLQSRGQVVMIASLAGRTAWPLVGAYVTSKTALVAYAAQLRLELGERLRVLTVLPGPIRRNEAAPRYQAQAEGLPEQAMRPGAGAPVKGLDPDELAAAVVRAAERGASELVRPWKASVLFKLQALCPPLGSWLLKRLSRS